MLAAAVLASWVAQAQPAPPPPAAPIVGQPAPPPPPPENTVAVYAGVGHRLGSEAHTLGPVNGVSVGGDYQWKYFDLPPGFELGVGLNFSYDKFQSNLDSAIVSQTTFVAAQTGAWRWKRLRPFVQLGAGISIGYASVNVGVTAAQPLIRGAAGLEVTVVKNIAVVVRGAYTFIITRPTLTVPATPYQDAVTYSPLGNFLDADAGVAFQF
jgi:hypothetical protein